MERKELSNLELFVGFFKTEKSLIDFDEIKEHLLKSTARDIFKERRLNGVPLKWEKNIHWLYEYIKDQFMKHDSNRQIISVGEHETLISKPGELHPTINDINIYDGIGKHLMKLGSVDKKNWSINWGTYQTLQQEHSSYITSSVRKLKEQTIV